jgi:hypothetical protein
MVNGGGAVTLQFGKSPFPPVMETLFAPWNEVYKCPTWIIDTACKCAPCYLQQPTANSLRLSASVYSFSWSTYLYYQQVSRRRKGIYCSACLYDFFKTRLVGTVCTGGQCAPRGQYPACVSSSFCSVIPATIRLRSCTNPALILLHGILVWFLLSHLYGTVYNGTYGIFPGPTYRTVCVCVVMLVIIKYAQRFGGPWTGSFRFSFKDKCLSQTWIMLEKAKKTNSWSLLNERFRRGEGTGVNMENSLMV